MSRHFLEHPKLTVSALVPDPLDAEFRATFAHALAEPRASVHHEYVVESRPDGWRLSRDGICGQTFPTGATLLFALEEDLENALIARLGDWIGFHAGAVALGDQAVVTVGLSDTGKTSSTFQLIELGLELIAEEVTPVDAGSLQVHPFPQVLTLSRRYAEQFAAAYPITGGALTYHDATMARYAPSRVRRSPVTIAAMLFPHYDPAGRSWLEPVAPGDVLTEIFRYCFTPQIPDERLYDHVIRVLEHCQLWRLHTRDLASARALLGSVVETLPSLGPTRSTPSRPTA